MSFIGSAAASAIRGGLVKGAFKAVGKGIKTGAGKTVKGVKSSMPKIVRGIKSGTAQVRALPKAVKEAFTIASKLPKGFGVGNTMRVAVNKISQNLAKASKGALNKDAAARLSAKLAKGLTNKKQSKVLRDILKNARANETWAQYIKRGAGVGKDWIKGAVRGGAENVAIDKSISIAGKALGGLAGAGATIGAGVAIGKSTK